MFVSVCKELEIARFVTFTNVAEELLGLEQTRRQLDRFTLTKVVPKLKGKLHRQCGVKDNIGSISLRVKYRSDDGNVANYSLLLFRTSVRIAGGVSSELQDEIHQEISAEPIKEFCKLLMLALYYWSGQTVTYKGDIIIANANAIFRGPPIPRFLTFCAEKFGRNETYARVYEPLCFETGPIAACHVYPLQGQNCSAKIQHTGVIQYLGFKEIDMLHVFSEMLNKDINCK